jgi:hypothetical protein
LAREDPAQIVEAMFFIVDKSGQRIPFILNSVQRKFYEERTSRDDILKARKEGFSSLILALFTVKLLFVPNVVCACVSHLDRDTKRLFEKVKFYMDNLPFDIPTTKSTDDMIQIGGQNSTYLIGTAGSKTFARGDTIHYLHMSEFAFYPKWDMVTGVTNSVPDDPKNTWIIKETTANGYGNSHHRAWQQEKAGDSVYKPHFFSWYDHPDYQMDAPSEFVLTKEEQGLRDRYFLTDNQLYWRRWKITSMQATQDYSREDLFKQEFPSNDLEAFLSTGRPIFDPKTVEWYKTVCVQKPLFRGTLEGWNPPKFIENEYGELRIFKHPDKNHQYVIGGDVAEEGDYSVLVVIDRNTFEQVAMWYGHIDEFAMAQQAHKLGTYYNDALIGIERNNMGVAVVIKLDELGYKNQYRMEILDEIGRKVKDKLGWTTDSKTRPIMISDLNQVLYERKLIIRSEEIVSEVSSFVRNTKGKPEAQEGTHDDCVMATAIAVQMYSHIPEAVADNEVVVRDYRPYTSSNKFIKKSNVKKSIWDD